MITYVYMNDGSSYRAKSGYVENNGWVYLEAMTDYPIQARSRAEGAWTLMKSLRAQFPPTSVSMVIKDER